MKYIRCCTFTLYDDDILLYKPRKLFEIDDWYFTDFAGGIATLCYKVLQDQLEKVSS